MNSVVASESTVRPSSRSNAFADTEAWRAAWKLALVCLAASALHGALSLGLDPAVGESLREKARTREFGAESVLLLPFAVVIGGLVQPLLGLVVSAWLPSRISDAVQGENRDARWAWGVGGLFLPLLALALLRAVGVPGVVLSGPNVPWLWPSAIALFALHGLSAWWMLRKHGFVAAWSLVWAVAAVQSFVVLCVAWIAFGAAG